jgi:hypothetical protein
MPIGVVGGLWRWTLVCASMLLFLGSCGRSAVDVGECACVIGECDALGRCVECLTATECDDDLDCTTDACIEGRCRRSADDARCATGSCDTELGCIQCRTDAQCADGVTCTRESCFAGHCVSRADDSACGTGFCDRQRGCLECRDDRDCDDRVACSSDRCEQGACAHTAVDTRCDHGLCDLALGCLECRKDADCADNVACTVDTCVDHRCRFEPNSANCTGDLKCDRALGCVGCLGDADCVDGVSCTKDTCAAGNCVNVADDSTCSITQHCDAELDCILCRSDEQCQDGLFCNGHEICAEHQRCVPGTGPACDDGISCTVDVCSELTQGCIASPDTGLCPSGQRCFPRLGCGSRRTFYAHTSDELYVIDLTVTPPTAVRVGAFTDVITDIAETADGRLFGISSNVLFLIDPNTAALSEVGQMKTSDGGGVWANGLTVAPDGTLYASGSELYRVDPNTAATERVGSFGTNIMSSGDIVWGPLGAVFLSDSAFQTMSDTLVSLNPLTAEATPVGPMSFSAVYGLSFNGHLLLGLAVSGELLQIDPKSGKVTVLHDFDLGWWGAS